MGCKFSAGSRKQDAAQAEEDAIVAAAAATEERQAKLFAATSDVAVTTSGARLSEESICEVLKAMKAAPGHARFLTAWMKDVFNEAGPVAHPPSESSAGCWFILSTDMSYIEVGVTADPDVMVGLAKSFFTSMAPDGPDGCAGNTRLLDQMCQLSEQLSAVSVSLWCRLKRAGRENPSADAGFLFTGGVDWLLADLLMPPVKDQDLFRDQAYTEFMKPNTYSCSLFPIAPEQTLTVEMTGGTKKALLSAFFFFKCLGFSKPEDGAVYLLGSCPASRCTCSMSMGPQGLTRLALRLDQPRKLVGKQLADMLAYTYKEEEMKKVEKEVGAEPDIIQYVAETGGYVVYVGWSA